MGDAPDVVRPPEAEFLAEGAAELLAKLELKFSDILHEKEQMALPPERGEWDFRIDTGAARPVCFAPRKLAPDGMRELSEQIQTMVRLGMARPSASPWGAPVLFSKKKDGGARLCFDYRGLNTAVQKERGGPDGYRIPFSDALREQFTEARVFSTMDALAGYWQIRVVKEHIAKTAVRTPLWSFEFLVMGFGHEAAPAHFQRFMSHVLAPFLHKFVVVFIDDICIYSRDVEEHAEHLRLVFELLRERHVMLKRSKCHFFQTQVEFLGHRIGAGVVTPVLDKVEAVRMWPRPTNKKQLRGFLGLANYYNEFINGFAELAEPLTELCRDEADVEEHWDSRCTRSFERLKMALTAAPVLSLADTERPYRLFVDASLVAVVAVLMQTAADGKLHPVAYFSKKLSKAERRYGATARELLGLVLALRKWRHYLMGCKGIELWTDCQPLTWLQTQAELQPMHVRWVEMLEHYPLELKYVKGVENVVADALSRRADHEAVDEGLHSLCEVGSQEEEPTSVFGFDAWEASRVEAIDELGAESFGCVLDASSWLLGADASSPFAEAAAEAALEDGAEWEAHRGLQDLLDEIRAGYAGDPLVVQALAEAARRARDGTRAPQSDAQSQPRPAVADQQAMRREAALEAAHRRLRSARQTVTRLGGEPEAEPAPGESEEDSAAAMVTRGGARQQAAAVEAKVGAGGPKAQRGLEVDDTLLASEFGKWEQRLSEAGGLRNAAGEQGFDLDANASADNAFCKVYWDRQMDARRQDFTGRVTHLNGDWSVPGNLAATLAQFRVAAEVERAAGRGQTSLVAYTCMCRVSRS